MDIAGTINSTTESAGYTYDLLGRLVTSSQTSNGASADRQFVYDRWANRTEVYDGLPGGKNPPTLIQSITLQQSGGAPTNRITSVTSGSTVNYTYDAAGNVTNDGAHAYKYDAENRITKVDDGATAEYRYDHQNRRVTKVVGSSWTHYIWEGAQVIGEHDATTPLPGYGQPPYQEQSARLDYVYSGARMISSRQRATSTGPWTTAYFLSDRLSVRMTLNSIGNVSGRQAHLPFGEDFGESDVQEKHHFSTYERESETGMDYAINRRYDASTGRFRSADPYRASGYKIDPQSWNRYSYALADSINLIDPLGLESGPYNGGDLGSVSVSAGSSEGSITATGAAVAGAMGPAHVGRLLSGEVGGGEPALKLPKLNSCEKKVVANYFLYIPELIQSWAIAENWEDEMGGGQDNSWVNAVKHCVWNCEMTQRINAEAADAMDTAHECKDIESSDPKIVAMAKMDLHNNAAGQLYGEKFSKLDCLGMCKSDTYGRLQTSP